jgi:trimethylamine--corrinoid protein Co-methyltransferase
MACKILKGIAVDEAHMAYDAIEAVGPGGTYLTSDHTLRFIRNEYFQSNGVSDKTDRRNWEISGSLDARERAKKHDRATHREAGFHFILDTGKMILYGETDINVEIDIILKILIKS